MELWATRIPYREQTGDPGYIYIALGYVSGEMGLGSMRCGFGFEKSEGIWGFWGDRCFQYISTFTGSGRLLFTAPLCALGGCGTYECFACLMD
jgi:hypothetical protein